MDNFLKEKVVVITGASSGIGAATARLLAAQGCRLVLAARSVRKLEVLAAELGEQTLVVPCDVGRRDDSPAMAAAALARYGRIDALFANAGLYLAGQFAEGSPEAYAKLIDTNVSGVMRSIHAVLPAMRAQQSGDIIITSSISGHVDIPWEPVYSASKHAVQGLAHTLRRQLMGDNIRVGSIAPGMVANELWGITRAEDIARHLAEHTALSSEDVARAVVFMLAQPPHVTIRDLVMLPQRQDL
ncbi:MAG: SDR family oxidoreductase [Chloroflexi bacterium]|nr:SDR family oxidoreductase [Chloroflexota bacterium]